MSTVQKVAKNAGIMISGEITCKIIALFTVIYLARYLGPVEFGKFSFVFAYLALFGELADLGLKSILVREMSRDPAVAPKLIGNVFIIKLILAILAILLADIVIALLSYPSDTTTYIYIAAFMLLFLSFSDFFATIFQANLRMEYAIIARIIFRFVFAILIFGIIFSSGTLMQIIIALVCSEFVRTILSYSFSRKFVRPKFNIDIRMWKYLLKESIPLALSGFAWVIYHNTDILMLSMLVGDASVGIYSATYRLFEPLGFISTAFMISVFPLMSSYFITSEEKLIKTYKLSIKYLSIIALPITIGIAIIGDKIIFLIYGVEFANSASVLQILIWALPFIILNSVLLHLLISINQQKLTAVSTVVCATLNVALNLILIPIISYKGAAIATVVSNAVLFITNFYFVSKHLHVLSLHKIMAKPVISGLIMAAFIHYFIDINVFLLIPLAGVVYFMTLLALKNFTKEDLDIVKRILNLRF